MTDIAGMKVVITGITGGIAFPTAKHLIRQGYDVVVSARDTERLDQSLEMLGGSASGSLMDLTDPARVAAFFDQARRFRSAGDTGRDQPVRADPRI